MSPDADNDAGLERDAQTYAIIGAVIEVHRQLGSGFLEPVYQSALEIELADRRIPFAREVEVPLNYKGRRLDCKYKPDFICYTDVIVELKALAKLSTIEYAIVINYLKATGFSRALLVNFGGPSAEYKRIVFSSNRT